MARIVTVQAGFDNVQLPDRGVYSAGDEVILTEEQYTNLAPGILGTVLSDDGQTGDVVSAQGTTVAPLDQVITDPPTQAEVQALSDKVDETITALTGDGRALAPA